MKDSSRTVAIAFASDDAYAPYLQVALASVLHALPADIQLDINILDGGISAYHRFFLEKQVLSHPGIHLNFLDVSPLNARLDRLFSRRGRKGKVTAWSYATYWRLFFASFMPQYDRVLYLDVDILVCGSLLPLLELDMKGHAVAAVHDSCLAIDPTMQETRERMIECGLDPATYFNAGILLINLAKWKSDPDFERRVEETFCGLPHLQFPDQDILNCLFKEDKMLLDSRWNFLTPQLRDDCSSADSQAKAGEFRRGEANGIIHYAGGKPWKDTACSPLAELWWHQAKCAGVENAVLLHETQLVRRYLLARREYSRLSSLRFQSLLLRVSLLFAFGKSRRHRMGKLARVRLKIAAAKAAGKVRLK